MTRNALAQDFEKVVLETTSRHMRERQLAGEPRLDVPLGEDGLGFDSIACLDLMGAIEADCGVLIPEKYWNGRKLRDLNELMRVAVRKR